MRQEGDQSNILYEKQTLEMRPLISERQMAFKKKKQERSTQEKHPTEPVHMLCENFLMNFNLFAN